MTMLSNTRSRGAYACVTEDNPGAEHTAWRPVSRIAILPLDPVSFYAYWEMPDGTRGETQREGFSYWVLRVHDLSDTSRQGKDRCAHYDIPVELNTRNRIVRPVSANRTYRAELGLLSFEGLFLPLARSNDVTMPGEAA